MQVLRSYIYGMVWHSSKDRYQSLLKSWREIYIHINALTQNLPQYSILEYFILV